MSVIGYEQSDDVFVRNATDEQWTEYLFALVQGDLSNGPWNDFQKYTPTSPQPTSIKKRTHSSSSVAADEPDNKRSKKEVLRTRSLDEQEKKVNE